MKFLPAYDPKEYESKIYSLWEEGGAFEAADGGKGKERFSMVVPPPNANGGLHIGFGLTLGIEDLIARYHRLQGREVLFIPGADHAGFETQSVFEKRLTKEGKSRFDFSRERLYQMIWDFVAQNRNNFELQFRQLGGSVNWGKFTFTLDDKVVKQAYSTFKKMWGEGLIYRGERLVNFCTFHGTAFADIEVEYRQKEGHLYYIRYPLTDGGGYITVATTRPETMFGDVAVAVHPDDKRYKKYIGKTLRLPLTKRDIPVIADKAVDAKFGTGAVKITPAHDTNDFDIGTRHQLPLISVINTDGTLNHEVPEELRNLTVEKGRGKTVELLKKQGYLVKTTPHIHNVGHCYKCGTVIQPLLREQWFVNMQPLAKRAISSLEAGDIKFYPDSKRLQLLRYLNGLKDWNISRQIAWGIPIPAFRSVDEPRTWIFDERVGQEIIEVDGRKYERDPDVFDTWFSSSSWPYVTLNYPNGEDYKKFYPLSLMETGGEILYPWVSRMIMLGLYTTGQVPFREVYIHGYVMAEDGSKISKSLGNAPDVTEILAKYGSDALRMGIISGRVPGVNRPYDQRRIEEARNLANKLWNVARFAHNAVKDTDAAAEPRSAADFWILGKVNKTADQISADIENYRLAEAYDRLYHFIWDDLADWYIEASKVQPNPGLLKHVLELTLTIAHPFAPFVTEAIWQLLGWRPKTMLAIAQWPKKVKADESALSDFEEVKSIITEARKIVVELGLKKPVLVYEPSAVVKQNEQLITKLAALGEIKQGQRPVGSVRLNTAGNPTWLAVGKEALTDYRRLLKSRLAELEREGDLLKNRLANKSYLQKAPKTLVEETKHQLEHQKNLTGQVKQALRLLD